jgi:hypothetical protein
MSQMKHFSIFASSILFMASAQAAAPVARCSVAYFDNSGTVHHEGLYQNVDQLSVDDCVKIATAVKKTTRNPVTFRYYHYNPAGPGNLLENKGWTLTSKITKDHEKPAPLQYSAFSSL